MKVSIITHDMKFIQGSNRVTEKLLMGKERFSAAGIELDKLYTMDGCSCCDAYRPEMLGAVELTSGYKNKRKVIEALKKLPVYNSRLGHLWSVNKSLKADKAAALECCKMKDDDSDCIIIQGFTVAYYFLKNRNKSCKSKTIMILHSDTDPLEQLLMRKPKIVGTRKERQIREMFDYALRNVNAVVTICRSETEYLNEKYGYNAIYITNGIDDLKTERHPLNNGRFNLAIVATIQPRKGQDILLDALIDMSVEQRNKIMLHIIGGGTDYEFIKHRIEENNLGECCVMYGARPDAANLLYGMDAFILPSRADTTPISIIEALRAGLPVISTAVGEIPYMVQSGGVIIEPDAKSVKKAITDFIEGKYDLFKISEAARKRYEQDYMLETMIDKYARLIKDVCASA